MEYFNIKGIKSPGLIQDKYMGEICLFNISDEQAKKLYDQKCPFLELNEKGIKKYLPNAAKIKIKTINKSNQKDKKKPKSKIS